MSDPLTQTDTMRWAFDCLSKGNTVGRSFWIRVGQEIRAGRRVTMEDLPKPQPVVLGPQSVRRIG